MRITALGAGLLLSIVIFSVRAESVSAQSVSVATLERSNQTADTLAVLDLVEEQAEPEQQPVAQPQPIKHVITEGESLSKIATQHQTTWVRIFSKNLHIENPDVVNPGTELIIPTADEQLPERPIPAAEVVPAPTPVAQQKNQTPKSAPAQGTTVSRGSVAGNTYTAGYCTWYVKNRRPNLPNNLGNAYTWVSRAAAQGMATGSTPVAGAAGQRGNHVVYVESVNADGSVNISEMNHQGLYVITHRTLPANYFQYIY